MLMKIPHNIANIKMLIKHSTEPFYKTVIYALFLAVLLSLAGIMDVVAHDELPSTVDSVIVSTVNTTVEKSFPSHVYRSFPECEFIDATLSCNESKQIIEENKKVTIIFDMNNESSSSVSNSINTSFDIPKGYTYFVFNKDSFTTNDLYTKFYFNNKKVVSYNDFPDKWLTISTMPDENGNIQSYQKFESILYDGIVESTFELTVTTSIAVVLFDIGNNFFIIIMYALIVYVLFRVFNIDMYKLLKNTNIRLISLIVHSFTLGVIISAIGRLYGIALLDLVGLMCMLFVNLIYIRRVRNLILVNIGKLIKH